MEFLGLRPKMYSYLTDDDKEEKLKGTKKCINKRRLKIDRYKNCLRALQIENVILQKNKILVLMSQKKKYMNNF